MEIERPQFRTTSSGSSSSAAAATSSELFICFSSRLSSSSMKLSKSLLSPARPPGPRDHPSAPSSLSSSLSRRLRPNPSLKASPFFPTAGKKRAFDNPEPSSPKVTCIGQVRVKTKKKPKPSRSLSKRRTAAGEVSFRKIDNEYPPQEHRNQRWVHLPISICEALRSFGEEFSCLFPCKSSCFSASTQSESQSEGEKGGCGAVFARWLVAVNDEEGGRRREIELVVGGEDEEEEEERRVSMRSSRRHVFEDIEVRDDRIEMKGMSLEREEEAARVSICIPPKNALLLMRCGSDPMKMAALANRFSWDAAAAEKSENEDNVVIDGNDGVLEEEKIEENKMRGEVEEDKLEIEEEKIEENEMRGEVEEEKLEMEEELLIKEEELEKNSEELVDEKTELELLFEEAMVVVEESEGEEEQEEEEVESNMSSFEALLDHENGENGEQYDDCCPIQEEEEEEEIYIPVCQLSPSTESEEEEKEKEEETAAAAMENEEEESLPLENEEGNSAAAAEEEEEIIKKEKEKPMLPECLLLMMCEPKLSMEVSRETWVCSTDFTRWLPERPRRAAKPGEPMKRRLSIDSKLKPITVEKHELQQPPRSSCSLPAAAAMATMIEQKLVKYEPFVLTRCKSEPMRTAAAKLAPESCFWKNAVRKLEPHAAMGVGAAGVGF